MRNLIQELSLQEMQKTFGGIWVRVVINGKIENIWVPRDKNYITPHLGYKLIYQKNNLRKSIFIIN